MSYADESGLGGALNIREESNYYPFGLEHKGYNNVVTGRDHKYGFGGKEEQDELGLGWIDITARNYDPALGRWMNLDPLAEKMRRHSPYNFGFNNPIYFQDYDGMMPIGPGDRRNVKEVSKKGEFISPQRGKGKYYSYKRSYNKGIYNRTASSVTTYNTNDSNLSSGMQKIKRAVGVKDNYVSASSVKKTQVGQFFDDSGNKVSNGDVNATSYTLTTTTATSTIDLTKEITLDSEVTTTTSTTTQSFSVSVIETVDGTVALHGAFETSSSTQTSSSAQSLKESGNDFFGLVRESVEMNTANSSSNKAKLAKQMKKIGKMAEEIGENIGDAAQN